MKVSNSASKSRKMLAAAVITALTTTAGYVESVSGATKTWTGTIPDPNSATYTLGASGGTSNFSAGTPLYIWDTSVLNWNGGTAAYAPGDDVVFTDTTSAGNFIRVVSAASIATMTFSDNGATPVTYNFLRGDSFSASSATPFGAGHATVLTLDTGFDGKVVLLARAGAGSGSAQTIVKSGTLEIGDGGALPNRGSNNVPFLTLAGGQFQVNVAPSNNTQPSTSQLTGNLSVTADSTIANSGPTPSRVWGGNGNGSINISAGATLKVLSLNGGTATAVLTSRLNLVGSGSGTILLEDMNTAAGTFTTLAASNNFGSGSMNFDLGTGSSTLSASQANMDMGALYGGANTTLTGNNFNVGSLGGNTTFNGNVAGGTVTKVGSGVLNLAGANTTTGALNANAGTLALSGANGTAQSATYVAQGGTFKLDNSSANNNDRLNDTTPVSLSQGNFEFVGNLASQTNEVAGALTIAGANTVKTTDSGASGSATITFASLVRNNGIVNFNLDPNTHVRFQTAPTLVGGIIGGFATTNNFQDWASLDGSNNVVAFSAYNTNADPTTWGSSDNIAMTTNSINVAASTTINSIKLAASSGAASLGIGSGQILTVAGGGILATSDATIAGPGTLTAGNSSNPTELDLVVPDATKTLTINSVIANNTLGGAVSLLKAGPGTLVLGASNTFSGNLAIAGGTLSVGQDNLLSPGGGLTVDLGTTFELGGFNQSVATVTLINGQVTNNNPVGTHGTAATIAVSNLINVQNGTISANLSGAASLTKTSGNTVTLSGSNSYTGGTTVSAGNLNVASVNALPAGGAATFTGGTTNINANVNIGAVTVTGGNISGTGSITSNAAYDMQGTNTAGQGVITAVLSGSVGLNKDTDSNASITLNAANSYTGPTNISAGTIATNNLKNGGVASGIGASSNDASNLVFNGATDHAYLVYTGSTTSTDRLFTIQDGANNIYVSGGGTLTFSNSGAIVKSGGGTLALRGTNTGLNTFNPKLPSDLTLAKNDTGQWVLGQANTIDTLIDGNGTLTLGVGADLTVNNGSFTAGSLVDAAGSTAKLTVNSDLQFISTSISAVVAGTGNLDKLTGTGTLSAANTFTGTTTIHGGLLAVNVLANGGQPSGIGASSNADSNLTFSDNPGTISYIGAVAASTDRQFRLNTDSSGFAANGSVDAATLTIAGTPGWVLDNGNNTLVLGGSNSGANTFAPSISDGGGLTKVDGGQWVLTGTKHTFTGPVTLNSGTLSISSIANGGVNANLTTTNGSNVAAVDSTTGLVIGQLVLSQNGTQASNLPAGTTITAIGTGTVTLSQAATGDGQNGTTFAFANQLGVSQNNNDRLVFNGGTLKYTGPAASTDRQFTMNGNGGIDSSGTGALAFTNTAPVNYNNSGNRTLTVTGSATGNTLAAQIADAAGGTVSVTKRGSGTWALTGSNTYTGVTTVVAGTLELGAAAQVPVLTNAGGADVQGRLKLDYTGSSPVSSINSIVGAGQAGNFVTGQIRNSAGTATRALGVLDTGTSVDIASTLYGDANLDYKVNALDFNALATNFGSSGLWQKGDFNYSGTVDTADFTLLAQNFNGSITPPAQSLDAPLALGTLVPEPASLAMMALASVAMVGRRRRAR